MKIQYTSKQEHKIEFLDFNTVFVYLNEHALISETTDSVTSAVTQESIGYEYDVIKLIVDDKSEKGVLNKLKELKLQEIAEYDISDNVNSFILNDTSQWIDRDTRTSLMGSVNLLKSTGVESATLWLDTTPITVNCDTALQLLGQIELYALNCFNVTARHKQNVQALQTLDEIYNYDYKKDYPEKLTITL